MISITLNYENNLIRKCLIEGHADYDDHGYDIVCAAISVLSCTAILGLERVAKCKGKYENSHGYCIIEPNDYKNDRCQVILETMKIGFDEISRQYENYVKVRIL